MIAIPWVNKDLRVYYGSQYSALEDAGYPVKGIYSSLEAIRELTQTRYPLIITSLSLPAAETKHYQSGAKPTLDPQIEAAVNLHAGRLMGYNILKRTMELIREHPANARTPHLIVDVDSEEETIGGMEGIVVRDAVAALRAEYFNVGNQNPNDLVRTVRRLVQ